jgi:hypothetical protein
MIVNDPETRIAELRTILLQQERAQIAELREVLDNKALLSARVSPIFEDRINAIKANFSQEFGKMVDNSVAAKLESSREELLNIIYPVLGRMIRKFVAQQIAELKDAMDAQTQSLFSFKHWKIRFKSIFLGVKKSDLALSTLQTAQIEEIYTIQMDSGLLLGSYSHGGTVDQDMIAGMLTAIKAFAEDAFGTNKDDLEQIEYGSYKILMQRSQHYYMAIVVAGALSVYEREKLTDEALNFMNTALRDHHFETINSNLQSLISKQIKTHFNAYLHDD